MKVNLFYNHGTAPRKMNAYGRVMNPKPLMGDYVSKPNPITYLNWTPTLTLKTEPISKTN